MLYHLEDFLRAINEGTNSQGESRESVLSVRRDAAPEICFVLMLLRLL